MKVQNTLIAKNIQNKVLPKTEKSLKSEKNFDYSLYNLKCPISLNYFAPSFGHLNPQARAIRENALKGKFAQHGFAYVPYNQAWSYKKILEVLDIAGDEYDRLYMTGNVNVQSLNSLLKSILPEEVSSRIQIKDMSEAVEFMEQMGNDPKTIKEFISSSCAIEHCSDCHSTMFLEFGDLYAGEEDTRIIAFYSFKESFLHELEHSLTHVCTNRRQAILVKYDVKKYDQLFDRIFSEFRNSFNMDYKFTAIDALSRDALFKVLNVKDEQALFTIMEDNLASIIEEELDDDNSLSKDIFESIGFFEYMRIMAIDEKEASRTGCVFRKPFGTDKPLDYETESLLFEEMEKFFNQKVIKLKSA